MNDKEIRQLLRELSDKAGEPGQVKSKTISITLNETPKKKKVRKKKEIPQPEEKPEAAGDILDEEEAQTDTSSDREEEESEKVGIPFGRIFGKLRPSGRDLPEEDEDEPGEDEEAPVPKEKASRVIRLEGEEPDFESDADDFRSTEEEEAAAPSAVLAGLAASLAGLKKAVFEKRKADHEEDAREIDPTAGEDSEGDAQETDDLPDTEKEEESSADTDRFDEEPDTDAGTPRSEDEEESGIPQETGPDDETGGSEAPERGPVKAPEETETAAPPAEDGEDALVSEQSGEIPVKREKKPLRLPFGLSPLALGILALVLAAVIGVIALITTITGNRRKTQNVTADPGLTLTVEREPKKWCKSGSVTLGVKTQSPIQTITVNGKNMEFTGKNKTKVTLDTDSHLLDVMVVSENSVQKGQATLQRIDGTAPEMNISVSGGQVNMTASDDVSGLEGIYYGTVQGLTTVPVYTKYTEPFSPEEGKMYYCTARDNAGNFSKPVVTDLTIAEAIHLNTDRMTMFPGETRQLEIIPEPAGAFLGGLRIVNTDSTVVSIDETGLVTALAEGTSLITISAENVETVNCSVTVRTEAALTISFTGDCTLGDDETFSSTNSLGSFYDSYGPEYFFQNVKDIFAEDDLTFVNLEGPFTDQGVRAAKEYAFRGKPEYTQILTNGNVDVVTLANNHSEDYGEVSLTDTEKYLEEAGIDYCLERKYVMKEINGVNVALLGIHALFDGMTCVDRLQETIDEARSAGAQIVIVAFHWGDELSTTPSEVQQQLGHTAIDLGADLVVGHHPHVLQGIEEYQGKYIVYSLANFCFGGNTNPRELDTMIFQMTFLLSQSGKLTDTTINIIPCSSSSAQGWNNYQPTPATGSEAKRIIDKINERSQPFGFSYEP